MIYGHGPPAFRLPARHVTCAPALLCRCGALSGIAATFAFPLLQRSVGLVPTGFCSICLQLACLLAAALPSVLSQGGTHELGDTSAQGDAPSWQVVALAWGLVLSRFGLWSFDLAANQLVQETVGGDVLGRCRDMSVG